jgi:iron-sulfur cluster assembly protein
MLTLTENATEIVKQINAQTEGEESGLRISVETEQEAALAIAPAAQPEPGDQVVEQAGAKLFLESQAAQALDDKVLDAGVDSSGNVEFGLGQQP